MLQKPLNDELLTALINNIETSDKKNKIYDYIDKVMQDCANLCKKGGQVRVLNEFKLMIENLRKEFDL